MIEVEKSGIIDKIVEQIIQNEWVCLDLHVRARELKTFLIGSGIIYN